MTLVTSSSGFGEMSFDLSRYDIRDRTIWSQIEAHTKGMTEVRSAQVSFEGWLQIHTNVGALKGNDKVTALRKVHDKIEQKIKSMSSAKVAS